MTEEERMVLVRKACTEAYNDTRDLRFCTEEEIFAKGFDNCLSWLFCMSSIQLLDIFDLKDIQDDEELQLLILEELLKIYGINRSLGNITDNIKAVLKCKTKTKEQ